MPKGWKAVCAIREAHHDPAYFENPAEFNPWRHEQEILNPAQKPPFFGFGGGPRYCPGAELARVELCVFLHHLVTKFDLKQQWPNEEMSFFPIPKFSHGLRVQVSGRQDHLHQRTASPTPIVKFTHKILADQDQESPNPYDDDLQHNPLWKQYLAAASVTIKRYPHLESNPILT